MIEIDVEVRRKRFVDPPTLALEGLSFSARPGEFIALVGPSGAGKSTLLNIVAGLDRRYEGEVRLGAEPLPRRGIGVARTAFVFQAPRLMPWLTVLDNLCLVLDGAADDEQRALALLHDVGLEGFERAYPARLSGGMQRRAALARAFAVRPALLLMDEPFVSLDQPLARRLRLKLMELWERGRPTVLYVTHDLREALALADRVLFLSARPGRVVLEHRVEIERPRADAAVEELHATLLAAHPDLLSGMTAPSGPTLVERAPAPSAKRVSAS